MAGSDQPLCRAQAHALSVMPQGALFEAVLYPPVVRLAKGDLAGGASVALMAMATAPILEHTGALTGGAWWLHALILL